MISRAIPVVEGNVKKVKEDHGIFASGNKKLYEYRLVGVVKRGADISFLKFVLPTGGLIFTIFTPL